LLARLLGDAGHTVISVQNGLEALGQLRAGGYDLLITDIYMPLMDGTELIAECRQAWPALPILAISGGSTFGEAYSLAALEAAKSMGVAGQLFKPLIADRLVEVVQTCLAGGAPPPPEA
jgi:CheY-like chemotaxis protein